MDTDISDTSNTIGIGKAVQDAHTQSSLNKSKLNEQSKLSLEDLLAVKKAEKPDARFWQNFDNQLEERTLRACMHEEPWYRNPIRTSHALISTALSVTLDRLDFRMASSLSTVSKLVTSAAACTLIALVGISVFVGKASLPESASGNDTMLAANDSSNSDYVLVENASLASVEEDFAVEIITIKSRTEDSVFAADSIPVVISDSVDYSDSAVHSSVHSNESKNQLNARLINPYTQLASFAF